MDATLTLFPDDGVSDDEYRRKWIGKGKKWTEVPLYLNELCDFDTVHWSSVVRVHCSRNEVPAT